jgi:hypothetical protein
MTIEEAVQYFGTGYRMCKVLGIRKQNYTQWKQRKLIPYVQQIRIEIFSQGELKAVWKGHGNE